jgi:alpha-1,2-mannosyltransferase
VAADRPGAAADGARQRGGWLLAAGAVAFAATMAAFTAYAVTKPGNWSLQPVDLRNYWDGGLIVRHVAPLYDGHLSSPLYDWAGYHDLKFTYTPFSAVVFAGVSLVPWGLLTKLSVAVNILALVVAVWTTFGALGHRQVRTRLGATLLVTAAVFWTEPVLRTIYLGQIELVLMALVLWDLCQADRRGWKGAGIGIAAGIKLVPLIFIAYLLITRRFRQAAVAASAFAGTILLGFAVLPRDSGRYWLHGLFAQGGLHGFVGWEGNQSLQGVITRLAGSVAAGKPWWLVAAAATGITGLACASLLDRAGHRMAAVLACALTALLISPISWDHHWVWIAPGVAVIVHYAARARGVARWAGWCAAAWIILVFRAWPGIRWGEPGGIGTYAKGLIWFPPDTNPALYYAHGDQPSFAEYHWSGLQLVSGNLYILAGMALFAAVIVIALAVARRSAMARMAGT